MTKFGIGAISALVGALAGAVGGYFFCKKRLEDAYYDQLKTAIDEECNHLREMNVRRAAKASKTKVAEEPKHELPKEPIKLTEYDRPNPYEEALAKCRAGVKPEDLIPDDEEQSTGKRYSDPVLVTEQEFNDLNGMWTYHEWDYLMRDGVVLDEQDQVVEDADLYLGAALVDLLARGAEMDGSEAFIIAPNYRAAVRVTLVWDSYEGFFGEPLDV